MTTVADSVAVAAFEHACQDAQVPATRAAAERSLAHLTSRPDAIPVALAVIDRTASPVARFHAATTLRTAATTLWTSLPPPQRYGPTSLRYLLVNNVVARPTLTPFERKALLRTAASLTRRAYLEEPPDHRQRFLDQVFSTAADPNPAAAHAATAACELLDLLAEEFLFPSLSPSAPAVQRHLLLQARARFAAPNGDLVRLLRAAIAALTALLSAPSRPPLASRSFDARALPILSTIFRVLATDVHGLHNIPTADIQLDLYADPSSSPQDALEPVVINAFNGPEWTAVIDTVPTILRLCFSITSLHTTTHGPDAEPETVRKAAQIVTALASIARGSYRTPDAARALLASLMDGVNEQKWSSSPAGVVRLGYAEVWRRVSCAHGLNSLERLGPIYLETFTKDTCEEMDNASVRLARPDADEDVFSMDVADMLLETWANLALQGDDGCLVHEHPLAEPIGQVMYHFTRMSLRSTGDAAAHFSGSTSATADAEEDLGFEDMSIADSRLAVASILTRFVLNKMAPAIAQSLLLAAEKVFQWSNVLPRQRNVPLDLFQEDLYFLIRLTAAILADEAKGEHPSVPMQFLPPPPEENCPNGHVKHLPHAQVLLSALFDVSQGETNLLERRGVHCDEASPRVGSAVLDALSRITKTYLVPANVSTAAATFDAIGGMSAVTNGRNGCFKKAMEGISRRGFESDIAESAANLLSALAAGATDYPEIKESQTWQSLLHAGAEAYQTLAAEAVQRVGKALTIILGDVVADRLLIPAYNSLQSFAEARDHFADAAERAIATVNLLRGAAQCENIGPRTREALLLSLRAPDGITASCAKAFGRTRPDVARSLIKLADDIVSCNLPILSEQDSRDLLTNVVTIVKLHADIVAALLEESSADDVSSDIEVIITLLARILDEETEIDVGEACYYGLSTVLPIMSDASLAIPSVSAGFFRFTARLVSRHPKKLVLLPVDFCTKILQTIDLQRMSVEIGTERRSLEAISSLARIRLLDRKEGPSGAVVDTALLRFLKVIFDGIASGSAHSSNLDAAADALLPLIHVRHDDRQSAFEELGQALLISSGNSLTMRSAIQELGQAASQAGAVQGFTGNTGNTNNSPMAGKPARIQAAKSFREAVAKFATAARNCLLSIAIGAANT